MRSLRRLLNTVMTRAAITGCVGVTLLLLGGESRVWAQPSEVFAPALVGNGVRGVASGLTPTAWSSMRAEIERDQYGLRREGDTYRAANPAHRLQVTFTREGVEVTPRATEGAWRWGLRLAGYGYADRRAPLATPERVVIDNRIEYRRGDLVEWYVNERRGIEQGFTLSRPPEGRRGDTPLRVDLDAIGDLRPSITEDGQGIAWRDAQGTAVLRYRGLKVWDARGRTLEARMEAGDGILRLWVQDQQATYPITIDPFIEQGKLTGDVPQDGLALFGWSVSISGDTAIVGVPQEDAAYVFARDQGTKAWVKVVKLAHDPPNPNQFGLSVAMNDDFAIVGTQGEADPLRPFGLWPGAAYIFGRNHGGANAWGEVAKLTASDAQPDDQFGTSVSISGNTVIVGARRGFPASAPGSAYVFTRGQDGAWGEVAKLTAHDGDARDLFGTIVSVSDDIAIVGAPNYSDPSLPHFGIWVGAAYIFARNQGGPNAWGEVAKLTDPDPRPVQFGFSVSISGNTALIGSLNSERVYIFERHQGGMDAWGEVVRLTPHDATRSKQFGFSVAVSGDMAIVGAPSDHEKGGVESRSGSAYVFARHQGGTNLWGEVVKLTASDGAANDNFGWSVSISQNIAIVGAPHLVGSAYVCPLDTLTSDTGACRRAIPVVNDLITLSNLTTVCCSLSEFTLTATFTNTSASSIHHPFFEVIQLTNRNVLKNADGGPGGVGATLTPDVVDGVLSPGESTTVTFVIGLRTERRFGFLVNVRGDPE